MFALTCGLLAGSSSVNATVSFLAVRMSWGSNDQGCSGVSETWAATDEIEGDLRRATMTLSASSDKLPPPGTPTAASLKSALPPASELSCEYELIPTGLRSENS